MQELPQVGKLADRYPDDLVVLGVHSPKYEAERQLRAVGKAVQRLHVHHPVVSDPDHRIWDAYAVRAWPTLVFLSPTGSVIGRHAGEVSAEALAAVVEGLIAEARRSGALRSGVPLRTETELRPLRSLSFPGKLIAAAEGLYVSDSGHHRVLALDYYGRVLRSFGSGKPGLRDGSAVDAELCDPQGLALDASRSALYVADAGNHAVRSIDLRTGEVQTIAGTGTVRSRAMRAGPARSIDLASPWDVACFGDSVLVAMAGAHQLWRIDPGRGEAEVWAGTGHEGIRDGARRSAWLAQPMGVAAGDGTVYTACAESQAVRAVNVRSQNATTLVGRGLFAFGDVDGAGDTALLQHCQGVAAGRDTVYVADTYNNKIKSIGGDDVVRTLAGSGAPGHVDGEAQEAQFDGPSGLSLRRDVLYVADTNNHAIRTVDLATRRVRTMPLAAG